MPFPPTTIISKRISLADNVDKVYIKINFTGSLSFDITNTFDDVTPVWETVTLTPNTLVTHTFSTTGNSIAYRIIGISGTIIENIYDSNGKKTEPGIFIGFNYV